MSAKIKAEGDSWRVHLGDTAPGVDTRPILFFCTTTDQRPYRVVEVASDRFRDDEELAAATDDELRSLFEASRSMGFPREYPTYGP